MPLLFVGAVDVLRVALAEMFHEQCGAACLGGREQQVYVIGHQDIGVHGTTELVGKLAEVMQVVLVVLFGMKADGAIIATPDDVPGDAGEG